MTNRSRARIAAVPSIGAILALSCLTASGALARGVAFPKTNPKVTMDVPDGWDVTYSDFGIEIVSPEKDLYIVADLLPRKKAEADAWAIKAEDKLQTFGVSFAAKAAAPAKVVKAQPAPQASPDASAKPPATIEKPPVTVAKADPAGAGSAETDTPAPAPKSETASAAMPAPAVSEAPKPGVSFATGKLDLSTAPTFTFMNPPMKIAQPEAPPAPPANAYFGPPELGTPNQPEAPTAVRTDVPRAATMNELMPPPSTRPKIPFAVGRLPSATLGGKPVDVQIVNYIISQRELFLILQASGPTDNRAVEILQSVKRAS